MSDRDLRPSGRSERKPPVFQRPGGPRWWDPLATKWGLLGVIILLGVGTGLLTTMPGSVPADADRARDAEMRELAQKCKTIANYVERAACQKPADDWKVESERRARERSVAGAKKFGVDEKYDDFRAATRAAEAVGAKVKSQYRDLAGKKSFNAASMEPIIATINAFYAGPDQPGVLAAPERQREISREYRNINAMPFESGVAVLVKYIGQVDANSFSQARAHLRPSRLLGKPEQFDALDDPKRRLPLFPTVPKVLPEFQPTDAGARQRDEPKEQLENAIVGIYFDCEEAYRPLYMQHLRSLFQSYVADFTKPADVAPQDKTYPLFLLESGATANEYLGAILLMLRHGLLVPAARQAVVDAPQRLLGKSCPSDRGKFTIVPDGYDGAFFEFPTLRSGKKFDEFTAADAPLFVKTLNIMYERCRPLSRAFYWRYSRGFVEKIAPGMRRGTMPQADLLARLRSGDKGVAYKAVLEALQAPAVTDTVATALPQAAASIFEDHCPAIPAGGDLQPFRSELAEVEAKFLAIFWTKRPKNRE